MSDNYVTIREVEKALKKQPHKRALQNLLNSMKELQQGKTHRPLLDAAVAIIECPDCFREVQEEGMPCPDCKRKREQNERAKNAREALAKRWLDFLDELNLAAGANVYFLTEVKDPLSGIGRKVDNYSIHIYRDRITSGRFHMHTKGHALRISTNDHEVKANTLRGDFGSKGLVKKIHNKCNDLFETLQARTRDKTEAIVRGKGIHEKITKIFPMAKVYPTHVNVGSRSNPRHVRGRMKEVVVLDHKLQTYDGEMFKFLSLDGEYTPDEARRIVLAIQEVVDGRQGNQSTG